MQVVTSDLISGKNVLLRLDLDVEIKDAKVSDDFRLLAGKPTLDLCLMHAKSVIIMGHIGRPGGKEDPNLSVKPIVSWFEEQYSGLTLPEGKLHILENLRFEPGEESCDESFAKKLASFGDFYINDAFSAHHKASSTTLLPKLLPHAAGLRFFKEVEKLSEIRTNPKKPFIAIIGGAKIEDKLPVVHILSKVADAVLVGGKLPWEINQLNLNVPQNVMVAKMNEQGTDLSDEATDSFKKLILNSKQVIWAGPMGKYEDPSQNKGSLELAQAIIDSGAESIIGGGDTQNALKSLLDKFSFVSTGGGAMLKFLAEGTLPTIEALNLP